MTTSVKQRVAEDLREGDTVNGRTVAAVDRFPTHVRVHYMSHRDPAEYYGNDEPVSS